MSRGRGGMTYMETERVRRRRRERERLSERVALRSK